MNLRRFIALVLCFAMLFCLAACNSDTDSNVDETPKDPESDKADDGASDSQDGSEPADSDPDEPELTPAELERLENIEYLKTVEYLDFELTDGSKPYYVGRWFEKEIEGEKHMVTLTDGSSLYFLINNASSFDVNFTVITTKEEPYFAYSIDGGEPVRQHITESTVTLPDTDRHIVQIIADGMTETEGKWQEEKGFALKNIMVAPGSSIWGVKPTNKVIFYYGDSITEGIRALNMDATSDGNSATNAYPWYCSKALGAVTYSVGYGATGVTKEGSFNTFINAIDYYSEGREVNDGTIPDLIVVNHGTNDSSAAARIFNIRLTSAIKRLQEKYEGVTIVYLIPFRQTHAEDIKTVMSEFDNVHVVETADWGVTFTDNGYHPDVAGAKLAGEKLAEALREIMGEEFFK